jgi:ketosteroid isomerase-like protein
MNTTPRFLWPLLVMAFAALAAVSAILPSPASAQESQKMNTERNRQIIQQAFDQWSKGGRTFFQDVLAPDAVWTIKGTSPMAGTYRNRQDFMDRAVKPFADRMSTPVRPTRTQVWADGEHVIVHWDGAGQAADGAPYNNSYVWIFRMAGQRAAEVTAFLDLVPYDDVLKRVPPPKAADAKISAHAFTGMWVTADGVIRQELLDNGRYDEARGNRRSAYQGRYVVSGNRINYWDDTGFTADGTFVSKNELHHGGMVFYRRN